MGRVLHILLALFISSSSSRVHSPVHYNAVNSIAIGFINIVNKVTNFPHGPGLELKFTRIDPCIRGEYPSMCP